MLYYIIHDIPCNHRLFFGWIVSYDITLHYGLLCYIINISLMI
jgi:hypothetical protein